MDTNIPQPSPSQNDGVIRLAAIFGFLAVALGAFGAHGLKKTLAEHGTTEVWSTAVLYHAIHAVALFATAFIRPTPRLVVGAFVAGILFFSGSLYVLGVTGVKVLGAITPIGGVFFLVGWGCLAWKKR